MLAQVIIATQLVEKVIKRSVAKPSLFRDVGHTLWIETPILPGAGDLRFDSATLELPT